jgi:hypothetical protein
MEIPYIGRGLSYVADYLFGRGKVTAERYAEAEKKVSFDRSKEGDRKRNLLAFMRQRVSRLKTIVSVADAGFITVSAMNPEYAKLGIPAAIFVECYRLKAMIGERHRIDHIGEPIPADQRRFFN